ncbi:enoyl-CoA hydratase/isomerase family protein [Saccharothrix coeruleofusca]|uniref:Enoyl-CoA hydratase n=1 Tax=Saccharothrix coeruleofusca TaxID=33919 RepID=A0A918AP19_9PSEU|nr:enoyl-CoA hydratase/isomerase family protein [Saccharothrix coeruleofusca]GGP65519.1 enoyl-CoA hydratase [Saccharothrix coeruleofusca]
MQSLTAIRTRVEDHVLFATLDHPPLNLIGPELAHDLVSIVRHLESAPDEIRVVVFDSAVPRYFSAHLDVTRIKELNAELARLAPGTTTADLYSRISGLSQVSIAVIAGHVGGAGSEFALACDMRFASREKAVFTQMEVGVGLLAGAGAIQHLTRLMGRSRALEVLLSADDHTADLAERYGWVNRALPDADLWPFVDALARRIAKFPLEGVTQTRRRVNRIALPEASAVNEDLRIFARLLKLPETRARIAALLAAGMQTDSALEAAFGAAVGQLESAHAGNAPSPAATP